MVEFSRVPDHPSFTVDAINVDADIDDGKFGRFLNNLPPPTETELQVLMSSKPVVLEGMLFTMHFTGDDLLKVQVGNLDESNFNYLKNNIEDAMTQIDKAHTERQSCSAASWEGAGVRLIQNEHDDSDDMPARSRSIKIRMFPRSFSNSLARIKEDMVHQRLQNCIGIETYSSGRFKQMIYLLPYTNAPRIIAAIEEANVMIKAINTDIVQYLQGKDFELLRGILEQYGADSVLKNKSWCIPPIRFEIIPLALNPVTVMDMVKQGKQTLNQKLRAEYEEGEKLLQVKLEEKNREMATQVLAAFKREIDQHVGEIVSRAKTDAKLSESAKADLDSLKNKAASIGLGALADSVIDPLAALLDNPKRAAELFGITLIGDLQSEVDDRVSALLKSL
jgi:hypothetical protein